MKVVIIEKEEGLGVGGIVVHNKRLKNYLVKHGHEVFIVRFTNARKKEKNTIHIPYHFAEKRTFIFVPSEKTISILSKFLKKVKPDIVHFCVGISPLDFIIPSICHNQKIPIVGIWHGDMNDHTDAYSIYIKSVILFFLPITVQFDSLIVFSRKLKDFYVDHGLDQAKIAIIQNGIDTSLYNPGESSFQVKHQIKTGIIFLGRLTMVKNPEILIRTFLDLNPAKDTKLILIGTGDLEDELRHVYQDERIIFTGLVSDEKTKIDILRAGKIFVLPSNFEGISLALLEAMSTGLACISADAGSNGDILKDAGIVINRTKVKYELPISLKLLLNNSLLRKSLGQKARRKVQKHFEENAIFKQYVDLYKNTVSDYAKRGFPKTSPLEINLTIKKNLETLWNKARELGANYLFNEE